MNSSTFVDTDHTIGNRVDFDHIARMSDQMRVPDSITLGPSRLTFDRDSSHLMMEVPNRIRPGDDENIETRLDEADVLMTNNPNRLIGSIIVQPSISSALQRSQIDDYVAVQAPNTSDQLERSLPSSPSVGFQRSNSNYVLEKDIVKELKTLQHRCEQMENSLTQMNRRNLFIQIVLFGFIAFIYFRRPK